jgi:hypothetical protein
MLDFIFISQTEAIILVDLKVVGSIKGIDDLDLTHKITMYTMLYGNK